MKRSTSAGILREVKRDLYPGQYAKTSRGRIIKAVTKIFPNLPIRKIFQ